MKSKFFWHKLYIPIWKINLYIFCGSWDDFIERLKFDTKWPKEEIGYMCQSDGTSCATTYSIYGESAIFIPRSISKATLVHELLHVVKNLFRHHKIDDEEAECYTLEYLYYQVTNLIPKEYLK